MKVLNKDFSTTTCIYWADDAESPTKIFTGDNPQSDNQNQWVTLEKNVFFELEFTMEFCHKFNGGWYNSMQAILTDVETGFQYCMPDGRFDDFIKLVHSGEIEFTPKKTFKGVFIVQKRSKYYKIMPVGKAITES